jgi:hypothetical protein
MPLTPSPRRQKFKEMLGLSQKSPECLVTPDAAGKFFNLPSP